MKLVESIMTKNPCYTAGKTITVKGLMLHSVGCAQPKASVFINKWNSTSYDRACVHGFIDGNDGTVYQTLPWNHRGWHCGGTGNNTHIGVEMCEPACIKYTSGSNFTCSDTETAQAVANRTYEAAVELFAMLCKEYSLNPLTAICSHKEGCAKGIASNHGDPEHLWTGLGLSYTMDTFRQAVKAAMTSTTTASTTTASTDTTAAATTTSTSFLVRVDITTLNIRKGAGTNYAKTGKYTGKGVFTITEVKSGKGSTAGWGKLKSGLGWVSLDYCTKI
jgi:N-acetylmuramoyl-L-alanine amidase CwlA